MSDLHCGILLYGPLPDQEMYDWLMRHRYRISLISTTDSIRPLPFVESPTAFRSDGLFGKLQMLTILEQTSFVVFTLESRNEEAAIRNFDNHLHIMYGLNGEFSYMILTFSKFDKVVRQEETNMAVSMIAHLFHIVQRGGVDVDAYSDTPFDDPLHKQFNFETASKQLGWLWR